MNPDMRIRDRVAFAAKALFSSNPVQDVGTALVGLVEQNRSPAPRSTEDYLKAYSQYPWLRAVVHRIAEDVSSVRWDVFGIRSSRARGFVRPWKLQRAGYEERQKLLHQAAHDDELVSIEEHPFRELMDRADPTVTGKVITGKMRRKLLVEHLELSGDGFWLLERNESEAPNLAWPIPPHWVRSLPKPDDLNFTVRFQGREWDIPATEMYWASDADPHNPYGRGKGTAQALADELDTDEFAARHTKQTFYNRARPDFIATVGGIVGEGEAASAPSEGQLRRMQHKWFSEHGGFWRQFKPHFTNRSMEIHELGQTMEQLQMVKLRQFERDTIRQVWGVSPEVMGISEDSNRATSFNARMIYAEQVLIPRLELIRDTLQSLAEREYDERILVDYQSPVPEDREFQLDVVKAYPSAFQVDEVRELGEVHALEDDAGKVHLVPFNLTAHEDPGDAGQIGSGSRSRSNGNGGSELKNRLADGILPPTKQDDQGRDEEFYVIVHRIADRVEPGIRERFVAAVEQIRDDVDIDALAAAIRSQTPEAAMRAIPVDEMLDLLGPGGEEALDQVLRQAFEQTGVAAGEELAQRAGVDIEWVSGSPRAQAFLRNHTFDLVQGITDESREAIRQALQTRFEEGVGIQRTSRELAEELRDTLGITRQSERAVRNLEARLLEQGVPEDQILRQVSAFREAKLRQRAEVISRTESIRAANAGQDELFRQAIERGQIDSQAWVRIWIVTPDDRLDAEICLPLISATAPVGEPFDTSVGAIEYPPAHPLCRCAVAIERVSKVVDLLARKGVTVTEDEIRRGWGTVVIHKAA